MPLRTRILTLLGILPAMFVPATAAMAAPADVSRSDAFFGAVNTCNGDIVTLEGTFQMIVKAQADGSTIVHLRSQGQGTGTRGDGYVLNDSQLLRADAVGGGQAFTHFLLVSQGSAPDLQVTFRINFTTGQSSFESACRG